MYVYKIVSNVCTKPVFAVELIKNFNRHSNNRAVHLSRCEFILFCIMTYMHTMYAHRAQQCILNNKTAQLYYLSTVAPSLPVVSSNFLHLDQLYRKNLWHKWILMIVYLWKTMFSTRINSPSTASLSNCQWLVLTRSAMLPPVNSVVYWNCDFHLCIIS